MLPTLTCGGYVNLLQDIVMWFSSGGTKSVLHADNVDNINCLFSGEKELYMVDKVILMCQFFMRNFVVAKVSCHFHTLHKFWTCCYPKQN